jgi:hypothetical protein
MAARSVATKYQFSEIFDTATLRNIISCQECDFWAALMKTLKDPSQGQRVGTWPPDLRDKPMKVRNKVRKRLSHVLLRRLALSADIFRLPVLSSCLFHLAAKDIKRRGSTLLTCMLRYRKTISSLTSHIFFAPRPLFAPLRTLTLLRRGIMTPVARNLPGRWFTPSWSHPDNSGLDQIVGDTVGSVFGVLVIILLRLAATGNIGGLLTTEYAHLQPNWPFTTLKSLSNHFLGFRPLPREHARQLRGRHS